MNFRDIEDGVVELIRKAETELPKDVVDSLKKASTSSISGTKTSDAAKTGYESILGMDNSTAQTYIENMSESEYSKFLKEAPKSVRDKFPHFDWD